LMRGIVSVPWYPTTTLYDITNQKTSTWNITAVKASKLACLN
jgi:hypothetical protein